MAEDTTRLSGKMLAAWGAVGALAPDVVLLYSKRFTMLSLTFSVTQFLITTTLYVALAAVAAVIFPYGRDRTAWKAFGVGVALPILISGLATVARDPVISPRGDPLPGSLFDLMALF